MSLKYKKGIAHFRYDETSTSDFPSYIVISIPLLNTELFLSFLKTKKPSIVETVVTSLSTRFSAMKMYDSIEDIEFTYEREHLKNFPELENTLKKVALGLLDYEVYEEELKKDIATLPKRVINTSYLLSSYALLESLVESIPREEAIEMFKDYVDLRTDVFAALLVPPTENLDALYERHHSVKSSDRTLYSALLDDGRLVGRTDRCMLKEILESYGDPELAYTTICHHHFHVAEVGNSNFMLTMTKTLVQGDNYCDFCWHDKRFDDVLKHPPAETWDSLDSD